MKIKTEKFKRMLSSVSRLVGKNNIREICNYIEVSCEDNLFIVTSTDGTNIITASEKLESNEDFNVLIEGEKLISLVQATNVDEIELQKKDRYLLMTGNGEYKLEFSEEEYPDYEIEPEQTYELKWSDINRILKRHNRILADDLSVPELTGYYLGEKTITLDGIKMAITDIDLFKDKKLLIPDEFMNLLDLFNGEEKIRLYVQDDRLLFESDTLSIFGGVLHGIRDFPDLNSYMNMEYDSYVKVDGRELKSALKRIKIFTDELTEFGVSIKYENSLILKDSNDKSEEKVSIKSGKGSFECEVDINNILLFLDNIDVDNVKLFYDNEKTALKVTSEDLDTEFYSAILIEEE